jgi:two-component system response regulator YesN
MMYRALIVDDEPIAIQSIEFIIKNNFTTIEIAEKARSGRDAIEKSYYSRPDIILMDINMPGINGLEAMRQIRKVNPEVRFIVTSAFDYFDYAVEAVAIGVDEYILKPVREEKLTEALNKVIKVIESKRESLRRETELKEKIELVIPILENGFINSLCMMEDNTVELNYFRKLFDYEKVGGYVLVIEFGEKDDGKITNRIGAGVKNQKLYNNYRDILKSSCNCVIGPMMLNRIIVYVLDDVRNSEYDQKVAADRIARGFYQRAKIHYSDIYIGIGSFYDNLNKAKKSYHEALQALRQVTKIDDDSTIMHIQDIIEDTIEICTEYEEVSDKDIYQNAAQGDVNNTLISFEKYYVTLCKDESIDFDTLKNKCILLIIGFTNRWNKGIKDYNIVLSEIIQAYNINVLKTICKKYIEETVCQIASSKQKKTNSIIEIADKYMQDNFGEDIALDDIARAVNLSPYYFSHFYKDETGINFIDKLTNIRIEKAKEYLGNGEVSIKEISRLVGYTDPNYFSKLFKKIVGVTATEYKEYNGG